MSSSFLWPAGLRPSDECLTVDLYRNLPLEESRIQRLRAVGCPVPGNDEFSQAPDLVVEVRDPERNQAFDFCFSTEYILDLRIKNTSFVPLWLEDVKGLPPGKIRISHGWLIPG
jgi:hypothetical protein